MTVDELKSRCKEIVVAHLTELGYPDLSRKEVIAELKPMWIKFEEASLMEDLKKIGWTYEAYYNSALERAREAAVFDQLRSWINS